MAPWRMAGGNDIDFKPSTGGEGVDLAVEEPGSGKDPGFLMEVSKTLDSYW